MNVCSGISSAISFSSPEISFNGFSSRPIYGRKGHLLWAKHLFCRLETFMCSERDEFFISFQQRSFSPHAKKMYMKKNFFGQCTQVHKDQRCSSVILLEFKIKFLTVKLQLPSTVV